MDDAFSLVASRMPRSRRLSPFGVRLIVLGVVATLLIATFAAFVVSQQRAADARRASALAEQRAADTARTQAAAAAATATVPGSDGAVVADVLDRQARDTAAAALAAATRMAAGAGLDAATTRGLSATEPDLLFVDGPSTAPSVVSVYAGTAGWAAAVRGGGDICYWVARTPDGRDRYGTGTACTGLAALGADQPAW
jgi:type II secretory pathway pseudopilin PulG